MVNKVDEQAKKMVTSRQAILKVWIAEKLKNNGWSNQKKIQSSSFLPLLRPIAPSWHRAVVLFLLPLPFAK